MFAGLAGGPALSSLLVRVSPPSIGALAPFYAVVVLHLVQALLCAFVLPESLSKENQDEAKRTYYEERRLAVGWRGHDARQSKAAWRRYAMMAWSAVANVARSVAILGPKRSPVTGEVDWSLPFLMLVSSLGSMAMVGRHSPSCCNLGTLS